MNNPFPTDGEPLQGPRVLLAEDDWDHAGVATWVLRSLECRVRLCRSSAFARETGRMADGPFRNR